MKLSYISAAILFLMLIALADGQMDISGRWTFKADTGLSGTIDGTQAGNAVTFSAGFPGLPYMQIVGTINGNTFTGTFREGDRNVPDYGRTFGSVSMTFDASGTFVGAQCWGDGNPCHNWEGWRE